MGIKLATSTTFSAKNLTTLVSLGTLTMPRDGRVQVAYHLTGLNGAAADVTTVVRRKNSVGTKLKEFYFTETKRTSTDTMYGTDLDPIYASASDTIEVLCLSTNASDTSAAGTIDWIDASFADVGLIDNKTVPYTDHVGSGSAYLKIYGMVDDNGTLVTPAVVGDSMNADKIGGQTVTASGAITFQTGTLPITTTVMPDTAGTGTLLTRLSASRAGYLDNLNVGGAVATAAAVSNISNNTFIGTDIPLVLERPDSGSVTVPVTVVFNDENGNPADIDAAAMPTVALTNNAGTSVASRLGSWSKVTTGEYTANYTNDSAHAIDGLHWKITGTVNGKARKHVVHTQIVDTTAVAFTATDRTYLTAVYNKLPTSGNNIGDATTTSLQTLANRIGVPATDLATMLLSVQTTGENTYDTVSDLTSAVAAIPTTAAPTAGQIRTEMETAGGKLDTLTTRVPQAIPFTGGKVDANATADVDAEALAAALTAAGAGSDWTAEERKQIRHQLGLDGDSEAPSEDAPDPVVVLPPADPEYAAGYLVDETPGTVYTFRRAAATGDAGYGWSEEPWDVPADETGMVEYAFAKGHTYAGRRAGGEEHTFIVPTDADTFALPEMLSEKP